MKKHAYMTPKCEAIVLNPAVSQMLTSSTSIKVEEDVYNGPGS